MGGVRRPGRPDVVFHLTGAMVTGIVLFLGASVGDFEPLWFGIVLLALAPVIEISAVRQDISPRVSLSDLTIIPAMVLLGPAAAAVTSLAATLADAARPRTPASWTSRLFGAWIQLLWPAVGSLAFFALMGGAAHTGDASFLAATAAAAAIGVTLNLGLVLLDVRLDPHLTSIPAGYAVHAAAIVTGPMLIASIGIVAAYRFGGGYAATLVIAAVLVLRHLIDQLLLLLARERELETRNRELSTFHLGVLGLLTATLARRDQLTARHSAAVSRWAGDVATASGCGARAEWEIRTAGLLHDIGKFVLPDALLHRDDGLSRHQRTTIEAHASDGAELVGRVPGLATVAQLIRHHHERHDGGGYPDGLIGEQIPLGSRILAICEAYDAMTARDSYRDPVEPAAAIDELRRAGGSAFDPMIVERFASLLHAGGPAYRHGETVDFQQQLDQLVADEHARAPDEPTTESGAVGAM